MKYFSMFSGIGGFELGIQQALPNAECVGYSEIDKYAIQIYQKHFGGHKNYGDATKIDTGQLPDFDLLVGGFPCQAFSVAGKRGGFKDTRGTLFFEIARILKGKQPRLCVLENVKGLLNHDGGKTFAIILKTLDELGYDAEWELLNSKNFGVPQNRERVFIIGHFRGTSRPGVFPFGEGDEINDKVQQKKRRKESRASCLSTRYGQRWTDESYLKEGLTVRRLTPTECERLQGFPDGWTAGVSDTQRYKTLGNAVTVNVVEAIMEKMIKRDDVWVWKNMRI